MMIMLPIILRNYKYEFRVVRFQCEWNWNVRKKIKNLKVVTNSFFDKAETLNLIQEVFESIWQYYIHFIGVFAEPVGDLS